MQEKVIYGELMIRAYITITNMIIKDCNYNNRGVYKKGKEKRRAEILYEVELAKIGFYPIKLLQG